MSHDIKKMGISEKSNDMVDMTIKTDQRRHHRKSAMIIAEYTTSEGTFQGVLKDIGAGGLYIRSVNIPEEGQAITLTFSLFDFNEAIRVSGIVSRICEDGFAVKFYELIEQLTCNAMDFPSIVNEGDR